jgi:hypothetical protein
MNMYYRENQDRQNITICLLIWYFVLVFCKDIGLALNTGKNKYLELGNHPDMMANEYITIGSRSNKKMKPFILFIDKSKFNSRGNKMM